MGSSRTMQKRLAESRLTLIRVVGALIHAGAALFLIGMIPYTLYAGYQLYRAVYPLTANQLASLVYAGARLVACLLILYVLWRLRQAGRRMRNLNRPQA